MRKLATVQKIREIEPIENADAIELAHINGWQCVVKKGEYKVNDRVVYFEIDSWIPHELAPFLSKGNEPREYEGVKGERLRTVKLRGALSQGLLLPIEVAVEKFAGSDFDEGQELCEFFFEGADLTELLDVHKWEPMYPKQLSGDARGNFPTFVSKTDEDRVQNIRNIEQFLDVEFTETEKLHGTSVSFVLNPEDELEVCSRNLSLKETEGNFYWGLANKVDARAWIDYIASRYEVTTGIKPTTIAIQGEGVGAGVQKGWEYGIRNPDFFLFTIQIDGNRISDELFEHVRDCIWGKGLFIQHVEPGMRNVPVIKRGTLRDIIGYVEGESLVKQILKYVEGPSVIDGKTIREGSVFRSVSNPSFSFKAVSNKFLLKGGD